MIKDESFKIVMMPGNKMTLQFFKQIQIKSDLKFFTPFIIKCKYKQPEILNI